MHIIIDKIYFGIFATLQHNSALDRRPNSVFVQYLENE